MYIFILFQKILIRQFSRKKTFYENLNFNILIKVPVIGHYFCYISHDKTVFWGYTNNVWDIDIF